MDSGVSHMMMSTHGRVRHNARFNAAVLAATHELIDGQAKASQSPIWC